MDLHRACNILDISHINLSSKSLKKAYFKQALKWHPDKNKGQESSEHFQEIRDAYDFLNANIQHDDAANDIVNENDYTTILSKFIYTAAGINIDSVQMRIIIDHLKQGCEDITFKMIEQLDKNTSNKMCIFLRQYFFLFGFNCECIERLCTMIGQTTVNVITVELTPSLDNLFNNDVYKLEYEPGVNFYIPLWHDELEFNCSKSTLIVKVQPILPADVIIDDDNHIHVFKIIPIQELLGKEYYIIQIASRFFTIKMQELSLIQKQTVCFEKKGFAQANIQNVFSINNLSDVYVHIELAV